MILLDTVKLINEIEYEVLVLERDRPLYAPFSKSLEIRFVSYYLMI
jgi:hypothetical protein